MGTQLDINLYGGQIMAKETEAQKAGAEPIYDPAGEVQKNGATAADVSNKDGRFRPIEEYSEDLDKAVEASEEVKEDAREKLPFTREGAEKAAEAKEKSDAIGRVVGYTTHPDTPVKLTTEPVTPSLTDAEAKAKALDVPVGTV
jgi:hypothetical protein